jgi:hypothetical protein
VARRLVAAQRLDPVFAHDPRHAMLATGLAGLAQIAEHTRGAIDAAAAGIGVTDQAQQALILDRT